MCSRRLEFVSDENVIGSPVCQFRPAFDRDGETTEFVASCDKDASRLSVYRLTEFTVSQSRYACVWDSRSGRDRNRGPHFRFRTCGFAIQLGQQPIESIQIVLQ